MAKINFNKNSIEILNKRYLIKNETGDIIESPEEMLERVVNVVCDDEILKSKMLEMMSDLRFLPNTPTLMNAGTSNMMSACFGIPIEDSLENIIHEAGWQQALIHKMGGGVGMNFTNLRPIGDLISSTGGITSGVLGFMEVFNTLSEVIRQGGKRDGANMAILSISHPEIESFVVSKIKNTRFRNFNLSVLITNEFMDALYKNKDWNLIFNGKIYKTVKAKDLFDLICSAAWECGCPGIVFEDTIAKSNPLDNIMHINTTNPCGELPVFVGKYEGELIAESCNLGSLNLSKYVENKKFNCDKFKEDIKNAVEFLDCVIDKNQYPFEFINKGTKLTRKIGLGITGLHESMVKMEIPYSSEESINYIESVMMVLKETSHKKSEELGKIKGNYPLSSKCKIKRRNLFTTCIAPTGTISRLMLGHPFSSGIEPPYALSMKSYIIDSEINDGIYPILIEKLKEKGIYSKIISKKIGKSIQNIEEIPEDIKKLFLTAEEIPPEHHIRIQSTIQKYVDNAVSKTINMRNNSTVEDVSKAFIIAWKSKCKGITIYRDNSKDKQVFESKHSVDLEPRESVLEAMSFRKRTGCSTLFITLTKKNGKDGALETFINRSSEKGGCQGLQDGLAITISLYNRYLESISHEHAMNALKLVTEHLLKKTCRSSEIAIEKQKCSGKKCSIDSLSCPNALAQCLKFMLDKNIDEPMGKKCPECGEETLKKEGCMNNSCPNCGWGGCS